MTGSQRSQAKRYLQKQNQQEKGKSKKKKKNGEDNTKMDNNEEEKTRKRSVTCTKNSIDDTSQKANRLLHVSLMYAS
jgi:hypothetical protein